MKKIALVLCLIMTAGILFAAGGRDQPEAYPTRPVEATVVTAAGGAMDTTARRFADIAQRFLGQPMPVVNRPGGGTLPGFSHVLNSRPDGYNLAWTSNGLMSGYYQGILPFNYDAFRQIARISYEPVTLTVRADAPWRTMEEFYRHIRQNPGTIRIGNSGMGTFTHLVAAAIEHEAGAGIVHVPFGTGGLAFASLMGGQIDASVQLPPEVMAQVEAGQLRMLGVSTGERVQTLPTIPTFKESGINVEMILWRGMGVPIDTPEHIVSKLEDVIRQTVTSPEWIEFCDSMGIIPLFMPGREFNVFLAEEDKLTRDLMTAIGANTR